MKCYKCNGTGYYDIDTECPVCDGTGEITLTNEEWRRTCSTEDFAKFLEEVTSSCYHCGVTDDISLCAFQKHQCNIKDWLKEKHHDD